MDRIAVISDVHGNMPALEAVLADIRARGIDLIFNLGDLVGKGARSDLTIDCCREVCQVILRGNWDDAFVHEADADAALLWYREQIGSERRAYLDTLPNVHNFWLSGMRVRLYHASQEGVYKRVHPWRPPEVLQAMFDNTEFTGFDHPSPDIVGCGDIHAAYMLPMRDINKTAFNAGSVGNPLDMPLATYAILSGHYGSQTPGSHTIDFVRLSYDIDAELAEGARIGLPELNYYAIELRTAEYRGAIKRREREGQSSS
ncbi:MAG: metallophosphatase family protein [Anaerolineae bacterium]|nr:metallophosphatase family protein [Anaerolineae bacterium]NUQ03264.1 metallophosphoesterase family protein [Anaerolineae bacterium]